MPGSNVISVAVIPSKQTSRFTRGIHLWREFNANAPVLPPGYNNFSEFLASRDFANFINSTTSTRPLFNTATPAN